MLVSWNENAKPEQHFFQRLFIGLSFAGGCLFNVLFYAPLLKVGAVHRTDPSGRLGSIAPTSRNFQILIIGLALFVMLVPLLYFGAARTTFPAGIAGALFVTIGIGILALALIDIIQHKTPDSLLLGLWVFGTFVFATMMNWTITSRTFLPMAPAVVILLLRRLRARATDNSFMHWWLILPAAFTSLLVTIGDYKLANTARIAASQFQQRFRNEPGAIWFEGHWGFQYYMQAWGAKPLDLEHHGSNSGDVLIVPIDNTNVSRKPSAPIIASFEELNYTQFFATTMNREIGAGFYSSKWGSVPWLIGSVPSERYLIFRIK
jgi:hypothetical protein